MSTRFFNNTPSNTLFEKLKGIASEMATFDRLKIKEDTYILQSRIGDIVAEYHNDATTTSDDTVIGKPQIIISETFI